MNSPQILSALVKVASLFSAQMAQKVMRVRAPKNIISATSIQPPIVAGDTAFIQVVIDLSDAGAPAAGAYEWGSGIHATRSPAKKYKIKPKNARVLALPYDRWNPQDIDALENSRKFIGYGSSGYLMSEVDHPGVEKRPYIRPTIDDHISEYRDILAKGFKAEILRGVDRVTVIRG